MGRAVVVSRIVALVGILLSPRLIGAANAQTWLNETDAAGEADFVNLQYPSSLNLLTGQSSGLVYGQLYEAGLTPANGEPLGTLADFGYGPAASDPRTSGAWTWLSAAYNVQVGNNDEYKASFTAPATGTYGYTFRFSLDNGLHWTLGDLDGAGSNAGLAFSVVQLGVLTVTAPPVNDVDSAILQSPASLNLTANQSTGLIYGSIFETGVTTLPGESGAVAANLGYGPAGTDPRTSPLWTWNAANYNTQVGSNDQYLAAFTAPGINGTYNYSYRFSLDGGSTWTVADLDANGTVGGLSFSAAQLGVLTVTGGVNPVYSPMDFNKNRLVDALDLAKWRTSFASSNGADADGDGRSDGNDFLRWQRGLGAFASQAAIKAAGTAVPEPAGAALAAVVVVLPFAFPPTRQRGVVTRQGRGTARPSA